MLRLDWYLRRLARMSAGEMVWRSGRLLRGLAGNLEARAVPVPDFTRARSAIYIRPPPGCDSIPYERAAGRILRGEYDVFEFQNLKLGHPPEWNRDPATGTLAPLKRPASLDHHDPAVVGDVRYLWELNRQLHLVTLAQAWALTGEMAYGAALKKHIDSWIAQCPPGCGVNWSNGLELAVRLINWSVCWQLVGGEQSPLFAGIQGAAFRARWLESVYRQTRAIAGSFSRHSSANNHLIGEAAGVWIASLTWPYWPQMQEYGDDSQEILAREALEQNAPDGGNREQAIDYQQFVLEFLLLAGLAARAAGRDFAPSYWQRAECMVDFLASFADAAGNLPPIGDGHDAKVLRLAPEEHAHCRALLGLGAVLFARADLASKAGILDPHVSWLVDAGPALFRRRASYLPRMSFPDSGYYLLGSDFETAHEIRLWVDAGPLGFLSLAAHGHADALAVLLSVGGREVLIDPGTYAYYTRTEWRRYFRSTAAHNTVEVDGADQSQQAGNFMWSEHARARCLEFSSSPGEQMFVGEHDGYARLSDPVLHRRRVTYDEAQRAFEITDTLECRGRHRIARRWHFARGLMPREHDGVLEVEAGRFRVKLRPAASPARMILKSGGEPEQGGWMSPGFGVKHPCQTAIWEDEIEGNATLVTRLECLERAPQAGVSGNGRGLNDLTAV